MFLKFLFHFVMLLTSLSDLFDVHGRLFNHRPFVQGEVRSFAREFEEKRQDREVENVFRTLELVTDLRDCEVDKLRAQCQSTLPQLKEKVDAACGAAARILDSSCAADVEQAAESSRQAREKEWNASVADAHRRCAF